MSSSCHLQLLWRPDGPPEDDISPPRKTSELACTQPRPQASQLFWQLRSNGDKASLHVCYGFKIQLHVLSRSLLVLGMDHYGPLAWKHIQENLLPTKSVKQVSTTDS